MPEFEDREDEHDLSLKALDTLFTSLHLFNPEVLSRQPTIHAGEMMSDCELLEKVHACGVPICPESLNQWTITAHSAQHIAANVQIDESIRTLEGADLHWLWVGIAILWERWFPDRPSTELLDDAIQDGYAVPDQERQLREWDLAADLLRQLVELTESRSIHEFDEIFGGSQPAGNWISDYAMALESAAFRDKARLVKHREFLEWLLPYRSEKSAWVRGDLGGCILNMDGREAADAYFEEWIQMEPESSWPVYYWAGTYLSEGKAGDPNVEKMLREALARDCIKPKRNLLERLTEIYLLTGADDSSLAEEFKDVQRDDEDDEDSWYRDADEEDDLDGDVAEDIPVNPEKLERMRQAADIANKFLYGASTEDFADASGRPIPADDAPCPCGSGKRFDECCGEIPF